MNNSFKGKTVLVIGGTGTIGRKIIELLLNCEAKTIRIFSRDEHKQYEMQGEICNDEKLRFLIGDVRNYERVLRASRGVDVIFHLAAMKHVPACEYNPFEAVLTNVIGTQNVIQAAIENSVGKVVFTSTDKAISPTNAMGASKLLAERLVASANYSQGTAKPVFSAVRFGNVMGSRGSVIPLFKKQIIERNKITITDKNMSRFMMSISDAAQLTMKAATIAKGGEIFVLKMPVINLGDLSQVVIEEVCKKYAIDMQKVSIENIGLRPGEKMYEELMTIEEAVNSYELEDMFVIAPNLPGKDYGKYYGSYGKAEVKSYMSQDEETIDKEKIREMILKENII